MLRSVILTLAGSLAAASSSAGQDAPVISPRGPEIVTGGEGLRSVAADRASVIVSVETRARTPSEAGALNASHNNAIRSAIAALGVPREDIATSGYNVYPMQMHQEPPMPRDTIPRLGRTGFVATNAVRVTLRRPEQLALLGRVIDTALTAGATSIMGVHHEARRTAEAEREALADALAEARSRAEAVARAAGGSLGELLLVTTESVPGYYGTDMAAGAAMRRAASMRMRMGPTSVTAGEIEVRQYVTVRWRFLPAGR
jgi:uncharacterized protein YggE